MACEFVHIGWCREGTADKVWGVIRIQESSDYQQSTHYRRRFETCKYVSFWGRRGRALQTKILETADWEVDRLFEAKLRNGYRRVDLDQLNSVYPEFEQDLKDTALWATLKI
jgi:hypothetical protein